jgi:hypothetical protein
MTNFLLQAVLHDPSRDGHVCADICTLSNTGSCAATMALYIAIINNVCNLLSKRVTDKCEDMKFFEETVPAVWIIRLPQSSGSSSPNTAFLEYLNDEDEATTLRRNFGNHPPSVTASLARSPNHK